MDASVLQDFQTKNLLVEAFLFETVLWQVTRNIWLQMMSFSWIFETKMIKLKETKWVWKESICGEWQVASEVDSFNVKHKNRLSWLFHDCDAAHFASTHKFLPVDSNKLIKFCDYFTNCHQTAEVSHRTHFFLLSVNCSSSLGFATSFQKTHVQYCVLSVFKAEGYDSPLGSCFYFFYSQELKHCHCQCLSVQSDLKKTWILKKKYTLFATSQFSYNPSARMRLAARPKSAVVSINSCRWPLALYDALRNKCRPEMSDTARIFRRAEKWGLWLRALWELIRADGNV